MEKYSLLIYGMTTGKGNIKERLIENLEHLHSTFGLEFPKELKSQKEEIIIKLTKFPALINNKKIIYSSYERTISKCRHKTLVELGKLIANLHIEMKFFTRTQRKN